MQIDLINNKNDVETANVLEMIIEEEVKHRNISINIIFEEIAQCYNVDLSLIKNYLKIINSKYVDKNNAVVGYINRKFIKRTTLIC